MAIPELTLPMVKTLAVGLGALLLFVWNRLPFEVVGLLAMASLPLLGVLSPEEAISGFSDNATLTVGMVLFLSAGLERTGVLDVLGRALTRMASDGERRLRLALMSTTLAASSLLNNTAVVAMMLPVVQDLGRQIRIPASRLLIPLSYASQLGGTMTLIGSSTNLLVAGLLVDVGLPQLGIFEITPPAAILMLAGVLYMATLGARLLPTRDSPEDEAGAIPERKFQTVLVVEEGSPHIGQPAEALRIPGGALEVIELRRPSRNGSLPLHVELAKGDRLVVRGTSQSLASANATQGICIPGAGHVREDEDEERILVEAVVPPRSGLIGRRIRRAGPLAWYGARVLAVQRHGAPVDEPRQVALEPGDLLLVEATKSALHRLHRSGMLVLTGSVQLRPIRRRKGPLATAIFAAVVLTAAFGLLPILVAALLGVIAMLLTRCLTPVEAYQQMDWAVLVLIASLIPLGQAMQSTGTAEWLASLVLHVTQDFGPYIVLLSVYLMTSVLTEFISNAATAVVLVPVAVSVANAQDVSPLPFAIAVMFAASNSFMTPVGYQTNTFVFAPGGYRFTDFTKVGAPLSLLLAGIATFVIPIFFPF